MIKELGIRISKLRKNKQLSQEELASLLNVSRQTISKWENQEVLPDAYNLIGLSQIFNISIDEILLGKIHTIYHSSSLIQEAKRKRDQYSKMGIIFAIGASIIFAPTVIIMEVMGVPDPAFGIITGILVLFFGALFGIGVSYFVRSSKYREEYKYLERLEYEKQLKKNL